MKPTHTQVIKFRFSRISRLEDPGRRWAPTRHRRRYRLTASSIVLQKTSNVRHRKFFPVGDLLRQILLRWEVWNR